MPMSLIQAYAQTPVRKPVHALVIAHFDAHGTLTAAARTRILQQQGEAVEALARFPVTGPQGLSSGQLVQAVRELGIAPQRFELIDIPLDVRNIDASILSLRDLIGIAPVYYYDHHETDLPHLHRLHRIGVVASIFGSAVDMAAGLGLIAEPTAKELAIVGIVADRDVDVLRLIEREEVEQRYLRLANIADVMVRSPQRFGYGDLPELIRALAEQGIRLIEQVRVEYPPEALADELAGRIVERGDIALLVDWSSADTSVSMWIPKTLEQLLLRQGRSVAIAVVPGYNPRTRTVEGYDVRMLKYWLAPSDVPTPEDVAKDLIAARAIQGRVVGHADYISIRFATIDEAMNAARRIFSTIEGITPRTAHLVSDSYVATAVRRDFQSILERLTRILENQERMYQEYLELKRRQVELLEQSTEEQRRRYD